VPEWAEPVWHNFVVRHPKRDALRQKLGESGIGTHIHYPVPPHLSGAYTCRKWGWGDFPIAADLADSVLSLPMGPHLSALETALVIESARRFAADLRT
jgi:dTDP-4-amino-4,6-dideoxygalactose transaminase